MTQTVTRDGLPAGAAENPLRAGVATNRITDPCNVVFFGASGDLVKRMLMPAMYNLRLGDILPADYGIIGSRAFGLRQRTVPRGDAQVDRRVLALRTGQRSRCGAISPNDSPTFPGEFDDLKAASSGCANSSKQNDANLGTGGNRLYYLSTPPSALRQDRRDARSGRPRTA